MSFDEEPEHPEDEFRREWAKREKKHARALAEKDAEIARLEVYKAGVQTLLDADAKDHRELTSRHEATTQALEPLRGWVHARSPGKKTGQRVLDRYPVLHPAGLRFLREVLAAIDAAGGGS